MTTDGFRITRVTPDRQEPSASQVLDEDVTRAVMKADNVERSEVEGVLGEAADKLKRWNSGSMLVERMGHIVTTRARLIYTSSSGDRWSLRYDSDANRAFVKHEANIPSGGQVTEFDIDAFLSRQRGSPEHQALVRLIGTLVEDSGDT